MEGHSSAAGSRAELKARGAHPAREWRGTDIARQIVVLLAVCGALASGAVGSGQFGGPAIVRRVWEYADGSRYSLQAVAAAVGERGWSFRRTYARFGVWNTLPRGTYDDRALYPHPAWWQVTALGRHHRGTGVRTVALDHLTNAALLISPQGRMPRKSRLRVRVSGPASVRSPAATVQVRRRDGTVRIHGVPLDAAGDGVLTVRFDPRRVAAVVVTLTNASPRMTSCDSRTAYACGGRGVDDRQTFAVRAKVRLP
jgi:hypothetical protein